MRAVVLVVTLAACGRFGFGESDPSTDDANPTNDATDGQAPVATPQFCDDRVITTLPIGALDATAIRAVALDNGYAVAVEAVDTSIRLLELDNAGVLIATHGVFAAGYTPLYGMSKHDDRPAVHMQISGTSYLKFLDPGWASYTTGPSGDPSMIDPAYAHIGPDVGVAARISGGDFHVGLVDDAALNAITDATYMPTTVVSGSIVPVPGGARVAVEKAGGVCETFVVDAANQARDVHTFSPCYAPKVAAVDDTSGVIVHRTDTVGPYAIHLIPAIANDTGSTVPLSGATYARAAKRSDGAVWIGHGSGSYRALLRVTPSGVMTELREDTAAFYFDLTERDAFWYDGATVHVSTPCLR
ncbi:MAG: hypothetical protein ACKV2T_09800 [Kofleriaceae bacterium]